MIDLTLAAKLLHFEKTIAPRQAMQQLEGAVALHNMLERHGVAYLADEVGMGKTFVALGAMALFRHFDPNFRVLIIAPRENLQVKWRKEMVNFTRLNFAFPDLRMQGFGGGLVREIVHCENLVDFARLASIAPDRDFIMRLTSFSLPLQGDRFSVDANAARALRDSVRAQLPWLNDEIFDLRNRSEFKNNIARALCCGLPPFDLVIVDEGHNLKHGFKEGGSARNQVLALAMGHPNGAANRRLFPNYAPRARRVLFLSATPVEDGYRQLWNQLDVFGKSSGPHLNFAALADPNCEATAKEQLVREILVRRVQHAVVAGKSHSKNLYRREWREGGVATHDEPIVLTDPRQKLTVALVQKKVSEILGTTRFNRSFQIGMLASFESFSETARVADAELQSAFDGTEQTDDDFERAGADVRTINQLAAAYRAEFNESMPHPKMEALVDQLALSWTTGEKALVFVRRVASVKELKAKLDDRYDAWIRSWLRTELSPTTHAALDRAFRRYKEDRHTDAPSRPTDARIDLESSDTFFAWFFRGSRAKGFYTGATASAALNDAGGELALFFERNLVAELLHCAPAQALQKLAQTLNITESRTTSEIDARARMLLPNLAKFERRHHFDAIQRAAVCMLAHHEWEGHERAVAAEICLGAAAERQNAPKTRVDQTRRDAQIGELLCARTLFSELTIRHELRARLWPIQQEGDLLKRWEAMELRARMLASTARLGHALLDLYVSISHARGGIERTRNDGSTLDGDAALDKYLARLEAQLRTPLAERTFGAFDELAQLSTHFDLILRTNASDARIGALSQSKRSFGDLFDSQQPIAGIAGRVNPRLVQQFRMPGYPTVLITTEVLQEGEDLHTFCSRIYHYGIAWTPSAMEQRTGRIDRVQSQTERRLAQLTTPEIPESEKMQVYYPCLQDTIEILQNDRVFARMNAFLRLMHEGIGGTVAEDTSVDVAHAFASARKPVKQIKELLKSRFAICPTLLKGDCKQLAVTSSLAVRALDRLRAIGRELKRGKCLVQDERVNEGVLLVQVKLRSGRVQPVSLRMRCVGARLSIQCVSPIGIFEPRLRHTAILSACKHLPIAVGAIESRERDQYDLTAHATVLLAEQSESDLTRVRLTLDRLLNHADQLERSLHPEQDAPLTQFVRQLSSENRND